VAGGGGTRLAYRIVTVVVTGRLLDVYGNGTIVKTLGRQTDKPSTRSEPTRPSAAARPQPRDPATDHQNGRINWNSTGARLRSK